MKHIETFNELKRRLLNHKSTRNYFVRLRTIVGGFAYFDGKWHEVEFFLETVTNTFGVIIDKERVIRNYDDAYQTILLYVENKRKKDK